FDVICALNGGDGLMLEDFEQPDLILLDLTMPGLSGFDVLRRVRSARPDVPVIIVSGQGDLKLARATLECGAANYLPKPFDPDHLIDAVAAALSRGGGVEWSCGTAEERGVAATAAAHYSGSRP